MKIQFLGAAGTVTGSKYLLENNSGKRILIDCGLFQGLKNLRLKNWDKLPVDASSIDSVVLTHAHIDHSGYLPKLVKEGFYGSVYCSPASADLVKILLLDCAMLMEEEAAYANRHSYSKHHPAAPLYTSQDAEKAISRLKPIPFHQSFDVAGFRISFTRAGHILGASCVKVEADGRSIVFSGDVGRDDDLVMLSPEKLPHADYLVVESTYGNRLHEEADIGEVLSKLINETAKRGGSILIPAFAVGRAQQMLNWLAELKEKKKISNLPVFLDSPMATNVTNLYSSHMDEHRLNDEKCLRLGQVARFVSTPQESRTLSERNDSRIIISASGMATGGRVLHHLRAMAPKKENLILFAGYQAMGTRGADLCEGANRIKIFGEYVPIYAEVVNLPYFSAHADRDQLLAWIKESAAHPQKCFITHGEPEPSEAMRKLLRDELELNCVVPMLGDSAELN